MEVEALPQDLPHNLVADISGLKALESKLLVKDIGLPRGVKILAPAEEVVALVEPPRSEEELAAIKEAPVEGSLTETKTEREVKTEEKEKDKQEETAAEESAS